MGHRRHITRLRYCNSHPSLLPTKYCAVQSKAVARTSETRVASEREREREKKQVIRNRHVLRRVLQEKEPTEKFGSKNRSDRRIKSRSVTCFLQYHVTLPCLWDVVVPGHRSHAVRSRFPLYVSRRRVPVLQFY